MWPTHFPLFLCLWRRDTFFREDITRHIYSSPGDLVGHTPLLDVSRYTEAVHVAVRIYAKLEGFNPAGSAKDRVALEMLRQAEADGFQPGNAFLTGSVADNTSVVIHPPTTVYKAHK